MTSAGALQWWDTAQLKVLRWADKLPVTCSRTSHHMPLCVLGALAAMNLSHDTRAHFHHISMMKATLCASSQTYGCSWAHCTCRSQPANLTPVSSAAANAPVGATLLLAMLLQMPSS